MTSATPRSTSVATEPEWKCRPGISLHELRSTRAAGSRRPHDRPPLRALIEDSHGDQTRISSVTSRPSWVRARSIAVSLVLLIAPSTSAAGTRHTHAHASAFQATRTFELGAGRATRTFTFRERSGVILLNRLTVPHGVHAFVDARIPHLAGARVSSWPSRNDPSLSCRRHGALDVCTQSEEWCPMPQSVWHFHLVKLSGPAGAVRFDYVVAAPPAHP
jgi:hypothetical protein